MSRIIAGAAGGLRLVSVQGDNTRPTTDRVKESLFSKLESYGVLEGARVLDLYGGSGALGCEALSRGAAAVELVDQYPKAVQVIQRNLNAVLRACLQQGMRPNAQVVRSSAQAYLAAASGRWDLVFIDPPYAAPNDQVLADVDAVAAALAWDAIVVVERSARDAEPAWPVCVHRFAARTYGQTTLYYLEPEPGEPANGTDL